MLVYVPQTGNRIAPKSLVVVPAYRLGLSTKVEAEGRQSIRGRGELGYVAFQ